MGSGFSRTAKTRNGSGPSRQGGYDSARYHPAGTPPWNPLLFLNSKVLGRDRVPGSPELLADLLSQSSAGVPSVAGSDAAAEGFTPAQAAAPGTPGAKRDAAAEQVQQAAPAPAPRDPGPAFAPIPGAQAPAAAPVQPEVLCHPSPLRRNSSMEAIVTGNISPVPSDSDSDGGTAGRPPRRPGLKQLQRVAHPEPSTALTPGAQRRRASSDNLQNLPGTARSLDLGGGGGGGVVVLGIAAVTGSAGSVAGSGSAGMDRRASIAARSRRVSVVSTETGEPGAEQLCIVCYTATPQARLDPCGHIGTCMECAVSLLSHGGMCPCCRAEIDVVWRGFSRKNFLPFAAAERAPLPPGVGTTMDIPIGMIVGGVRHGGEGVLPRPHPDLLPPHAQVEVTTFWRILDVARRYPDETRMQVKAAWALRVALRSEEIRVTLTAQAIRAILIIPLIYRSSPEMSQCGCASIRNIAWQTELRLVAAETGAVRAVVVHLTQHPRDDEVQAQGLAAFVNFFLSDELNPFLCTDEVLRASLRALSLSRSLSVCSSAMYIVCSMTPTMAWVDTCEELAVTKLVVERMMLFPHDGLLVSKGLVIIERLLHTDRCWNDFVESRGDAALLTLASQHHGSVADLIEIVLDEVARRCAPPTGSRASAASPGPPAL